MSGNNKKHRNIESNSPFRMILITLSSRRTAKAGIRLLWSAVAEFFIPQFQTKIRPSTRPVVSVDHDLDAGIPFLPDQVELYLGFIPLWIKSLYFIYREFGRRSMPGIAEFLDGISELYRKSGRVYKIRQSTTQRPKYLRGMRFVAIHAFDPHLHCVPSLHVLTVVYNYVMILKLVEKFSAESTDPADTDYSEQKNYLYNQAVAITESILLIKQHSVNCVPAALFAMTRLHPEFSVTDAGEFVDHLFLKEDSTLEKAAEIKSFMHEQYQYFTDSIEEKQCGFGEVLLDFLESCRLYPAS